MNKPIRFFLTGIALCLSITVAHAQARLTEGDILQSLITSGSAAAAAGFDVNAIRRDIEKRIQVEGTENAASPPPALWGPVGSLTPAARVIWRRSVVPCTKPFERSPQLSGVSVIRHDEVEADANQALG